MAGQIRISVGAAPAAPPATTVTLYAKANKKLYSKDDAGVESLLSGPSTSDDVPEGVANQYFTVEKAQDAVGSALVNTADIDLTYNDGANTIKADLTATGAISGTYGSGSNAVTMTLDNKGRISSVTETPITVSLAALAEAYGFVLAGDTVVQAISKLAYGQTLQKRIIAADALITTGQTWIRGETDLTGTAEILLQGDSELRFI